MSAFLTYLELGFRHILDLRGIDHILFVVALCAPYQLKHWKSLLILVTAFTIGHSLTLVLASMDMITLSGDFVELIIALTIAFTALQNVFLPLEDRTSTRLKYILALVFGLFHGLGFSGYFQTLLGREESILLPLFSFNLGIEAGQLLLVCGILLFLLIADRYKKIKARDWNLFLSGTAFGASLLMIIDRI